MVDYHAGGFEPGVGRTSEGRTVVWLLWGTLLTHSSTLRDRYSAPVTPESVTSLGTQMHKGNNPVSLTAQKWKWMISLTDSSNSWHFPRLRDLPARAGHWGQTCHTCHWLWPFPFLWGDLLAPGTFEGLCPLDCPRGRTVCGSSGASGWGGFIFSRPRTWWHSGYIWH